MSYCMSATKGVQRKRDSMHLTLTPQSDWFLISPYNITLESNVKNVRIKEMITNVRSYPDC